MERLSTSIKRLQIDKANARMVISISAASFIVVFSLVASKALLGQRGYQSRVIAAKVKAVNQLKQNVSAAQTLVNSYTAFVSAPDNVLGGSTKGNGDRDGDNAKIVLDALPSKYDFPALATSLEKILTSQNYKINSIAGTDDELQQQNTLSSPAPKPIEIPFQISVSGNYSAMQNFINTLERSIRPIQVQTISFSAGSGGLQGTISAKTFYQPEKSLTITTKEIK